MVKSRAAQYMLEDHCVAAAITMLVSVNYSQDLGLASLTYDNGPRMPNSKFKY